MERRVRHRALAAGLGLVGLALSSATAAAAGTASEVTGGMLGWPDGFSLQGLTDGLISVLSVQLLVGFALGLAANEAGRVAWGAGRGAMKSLLSFSTIAAQYGAIAAVLGTVLYFV